MLQSHTLEDPGSCLCRGQAGGVSGQQLSDLQHDLMGSDAHLLNTTESAYQHAIEGQDNQHDGQILESQTDSVDSLEHAPGVAPPSSRQQQPGGTWQR